MKPARLARSGQLTRAGRNRLLDRSSLDGRTATAKAFDALVGAIHSDLGGKDQLSAIELALTESFAGAAIVLDHLNARILAGDAIGPALVAMHAATISAQVRIASRLGTGRRMKEVSTLGEMLREDQQRRMAERQMAERQE